MEGKTQEAAAAAAGMSVRSARKWESGPLPSQVPGQRQWRTHADAFTEVWALDLVPLLERDEARILEATTLLEILEDRYPGRFSSKQLRTLQRRVRDWRAVHGSEKTVYFPQQHVPGREAQLDFTHAGELGVTICGEPFPHLLFELILSFSGWRFVQISYGETFEALVDGLQEALWSLGGVPEVARTDNLSAATHDLKRTAGRALTPRFAAVLEHYGLRSTRIHPGASHENGVVEQGHRRLKSALAQALVVRGHRDFRSVEAYEAFVAQVVAKMNLRKADRLEEERPALRPLPPHRVANYTRYDVQVRKWSTIRINTHAYSVPSRLIGHRVEVRQFANRLDVLYRGERVEQIPRLRGGKEHRINYRHIIWSLVRKPGAFARYRYREELFPSLTFRRAYDALLQEHGPGADLEYLRILHLAAGTSESDVEAALAELLARRLAFDYIAVRELAAPTSPEVPPLEALQAPDLGTFDELLSGGRL
jgi:hypothetical protein